MYTQHNLRFWTRQTRTSVDREFSRHGAESYGAAVLLHNRAGDDLGGLDEPVVTAGVLRGTNQGHWTAKAWAWTQHRHKDGEWEQFKFPDNSGRADVFALPLASIVSASSLELRVIRPLVEKAIRPADK